MITRRAYIVLLFSTVLVLSACGRDRRHRARHHLTPETEVTPSSPKGHGEDASSATEIWSEEVFELLAPAMPGYVPSQILERLGYITSYNHDTKCPNWVAWHLTKERTDGPFPRKGVPYYDENGTAIGIGDVTPETQRGDYFLARESEEPRQLLTDWPNNEYRMTHGHICPAADNRWSKAAMNQSFLLTNMCPQDGNLNGGGWQKLEDKCRTWAMQFGGIYIVSGPIYSGGKVSRTIGASKVAVPDAFFKVVLCLEGTPKAIGFLYKNDSSSQSIKDCVCSVDIVEELTGFDFFYSLSDDIEDVVESDANLSKWN